MAKVLIVEDERQIAEYIYKYLTHAGFEAIVLNSGEFAVATVKKEQPDLVVLDVMLPVKDGVACCKEIRTFSDVPVIMLTAKSRDIDRIVGLEAGADDYVCKPFNAKELVLRVQAILKRFHVAANVDEGLILDNQNFTITYNEKMMKLTLLEFSLFQLLVNKPSRIFSRQQIISLAYTEEKDITERAVDSHVKNLRKKIKSLGIEEVVIDCVYGAGYQYLPIE